MRERGRVRLRACVSVVLLADMSAVSLRRARKSFVLCRDARDHGISAVGLPSRLAAFKALPLPALDGAGRSGEGGKRGASWWDLPHRRAARGGGTAGSGAAGAGSPTAVVELCNSERAGGKARPSSSGGGSDGGGSGCHGKARRGLASPVCRIEVPQLAPAWAPKIQMFLPSFR